MLRFGSVAVVLALAALICGFTALPEGRSWVHAPGSNQGKVRILQFRASVAALASGEKAQLCYGVENARMVRISPAPLEVSPSGNRCVDIFPRHTTHYVIVAEGYDGSLATESLTLPVRTTAPVPPRPVQFSFWLLGRAA